MVRTSPCGSPRMYPRGTRFPVEVQEGATAEELATLRRALQGVSTHPF